MKLLATVSDPSRVGIVLDLATGKEIDVPSRASFHDVTVERREHCRPFGIAWDGGRLFVANNRQLNIFDRNLEYLRTAGTVLQTNVHQAAFKHGRVWVVSPWTNSIIGIRPDAINESERGREAWIASRVATRVDITSSAVAIELMLLDERLVEYRVRQGCETDDLVHFNSLLWTDEHLYVAAHCFKRPSFILRFRIESMRIDALMEGVGFEVHGLAHDRQDLYWISTGTSEIRSSSGVLIPIERSGYVRGLAMTDELLVVAISEFQARDRRRGGDSWIQILERPSGTLMTEFALRNTGSVNDIRLLDKFDYAHWVPPFW